MTRQASCARPAIGATVSTAVPLLGALGTPRSLLSDVVCALTVVGVGALFAVEVVRAGVRAEVGTHVERYVCISWGLVAFIASRDHLFACLAAGLSQPEALTA